MEHVPMVARTANRVAIELDLRVEVARAFVYLSMAVSKLVDVNPNLSIRPDVKLKNDMPVTVNNFVIASTILAVGEALEFSREQVERILLHVKLAMVDEAKAALRAGAFGTDPMFKTLMEEAVRADESRKD